jgi:hypothetical protein
MGVGFAGVNGASVQAKGASKGGIHKPLTKTMVYMDYMVFISLLVPK